MFFFNFQRWHKEKKKTKNRCSTRRSCRRPQSRWPTSTCSRIYCWSQHFRTQNRRQPSSQPRAKSISATRFSTTTATITTGPKGAFLLIVYYYFTVYYVFILFFLRCHSFLFHMLLFFCFFKKLTKMFSFFFFSITKIIVFLFFILY